MAQISVSASRVGWSNLVMRCIENSDAAGDMYTSTTLDGEAVHMYRCLRAPRSLDGSTRAVGCGWIAKHYGNKEG